MGYAYLNRSTIIAKGIAKLNEQLAVPVQVSTVELDLFSGLPRVEIVLNNLHIADPFSGEAPLALARRVALGINLWSIVEGSYVPDALSIEGGSLYFSTSAKGNNWDLIQADSDSTSTLQFAKIILSDLEVTYDDQTVPARYSGWVDRAVLSGTLAEQSTLALEATLERMEVVYEGEKLISGAPISGEAAIAWDDAGWSVQGEDVRLDGQRLALNLNQDGGSVDAAGLNVPSALVYFPEVELDGFSGLSLRANFAWSGSYENWQLTWTGLQSSFTVDDWNLRLTSFTGDGQLRWGEEKSVRLDRLVAKTKTGEIQGSLSLDGREPVLRTQLRGSSDLSELFAFIDGSILVDPKGRWSGEDLKINQRFASWEDFTPVGNPSFQGVVALRDVAFGLSESNIYFEKVEADLVADGRHVKVDRCFLQSGSNNAVVAGTIYDALLEGGYPQVTLRLESPFIDIDPLLFWEFEDDGSSSEDFGFNFSVDLAVDEVSMGDFRGTTLRGTVFNRGTKILGKDMSIRGCDGIFAGNWALAEEAEGARFWTEASATDVQLDQLLASFNNFEIDDLDASNLSGRATVKGTCTLHFDKNWDVIGPKTVVDGHVVVQNGQLKNYAPLQELSAFIDSKELERISFPRLETDFAVRGDTLILPETKVENSAMNLWVNGWQNLETDDIRYSVRLGLKDLALRGKNSNRDLGNWIAEAENESQPYIRLLIGCNLDDVCISLDRARIRQSFRENVQQEREDLRTLFQREEPGTQYQETPGSGSFELLWPEADSLRVRSLEGSRFDSSH